MITKSLLIHKKWSSVTTYTATWSARNINEGMLQYRGPWAYLSSYPLSGEVAIMSLQWYPDETSLSTCTNTAPPTQTLLGIRHAFLSHERLLKRAAHSFPFVKKSRWGYWGTNQRFVDHQRQLLLWMNHEKYEAFSKYSSETLILFPWWVMHLHSGESTCEFLARVWCRLIH